MTVCADKHPKYVLVSVKEKIYLTVTYNEKEGGDWQRRSEHHHVSK